MFKQPFLLAVVFLCLAALPLFAQSSADLQVTKDGPSTLVAGTDVPYTIVLTNLGPDDASTVDLNDPIPPGMTFVSINQPGGFACSTPAVGSGGTVDCTNATMTAGTSVTFNLVVHLDPSTPPGTFFTNIATASSPDDPNDENNQGVSVGSTAPPPTGDLAVTKVGPDTAAANTDVTYTINVFNGGPQAASTVTVTDTLPGNMTFVSLTGTTGFSCTTPSPGAGGTITCTIASYPANTGQIFTLVGHIPPGTAGGTEYTNTATVTSSNDENPDNNTSTVSTIVSSSDMSIMKTAPGTADAGTNAAYVITIMNNGPDVAQSAGFTDTLPAGTTFVSVAQNSGSPSTCNAPAPGSGGTVSCALFANLNSGGSAQFTVTVKINSSVAAGTVISNTATATTQSADPNSGNNSATAPTTVTALADVAVSKSAPPTTAPNSDVTFTIGASNNSGPSDAQSITISDSTPANTTFVSMTAPGYSCITPAVGGTGAISCTRPTLAVGANTTLLLVVHTTNAAIGPITNTVTISSTTTDPNPSNNTANVTSSSIATDLGISKTAPGTAVASSNISYMISATNSGPNAATSVVVTDVMPPNTTFVSISTPAGFNCSTPAVGGNGTITCNAPTFPNPSTAVFTLVLGTSPGGVGTTVSNTATITSATADFNSANNSSTASTTLTGSADLAVTKTATAAPDNSKVAYNVTVTNNGPSDAATVTMSDATPAGTTFVSNTQTSGPAFACTNPAAGGTGTITCTIGTLAAGASANFKLVFQPTGSGQTTNTATVSSPTLDPNPANNSATGASTAANGIPAVSPLGLAALALALATIAGVVLRRG
jgi:uncharacterized repeat protein (TIGR01451 family)